MVSLSVPSEDSSLERVHKKAYVWDPEADHHCMLSCLFLFLNWNTALNLEKPALQEFLVAGQESLRCARLLNKIHPLPFRRTLVEHLKDSNQVQAFYDECLLSGAETDSDKQAQLAAYLLVKIDERSAQRGLCSKQRLSLSEP